MDNLKKDPSTNTIISLNKNGHSIDFLQEKSARIIQIQWKKYKIKKLENCQKSKEAFKNEKSVLENKEMVIDSRKRVENILNILENANNTEMSIREKTRQSTDSLVLGNDDACAVVHSRAFDKRENSPAKLAQTVCQNFQNKISNLNSEIENFKLEINNLKIVIKFF